MENGWITDQSTILPYDFASCETGTNSVDLYLHLVARLGLWDENYEAFDPCDSVTATASLFDLNFVFLPFLHWLTEGTLRTHAFHLGDSLSSFFGRKQARRHVRSR